MKATAAKAIGITGGIACGKSEVAKIFEDFGVPVLDTDCVAHDLMRAGEPVYEQIVKEFGKGILAESGEIDRKKLGATVFNQDGRLKRLNDLVHPEVGRIWRDWLKAHLETGRSAAVIIPLLYEVNATEGWDAIITVAASPERVLERLKGRGFVGSDAEARISAQWPLEKKIELADYVLENNGSLEDLRIKAIQLLNQVLA